MADELRLRALKHGRTAMARYRAGKYKRMIGPANRAETALFELICREPDDVSVAVAFGEVASVRSSTMVAIPGALAGSVAVQAARASLWAFDRAAPPAEVTVAEEPPSTEFVWLDEDALAPLPAGARAGAAANARLMLAELLAGQPPQPAKARAMGAAELNRTLRERAEFQRGDEALVWDYRTDSTVGLDTHAEARVLVTEAVQAYEYLVAREDRFGLANGGAAKERHDLVVATLRS